MAALSARWKEAKEANATAAAASAGAEAEESGTPAAGDGRSGG